MDTTSLPLILWQQGTTVSTVTVASEIKGFMEEITGKHNNCWVVSTYPYVSWEKSL